MDWMDEILQGKENLIADLQMYLSGFKNRKFMGYLSKIVKTIRD